MCQFLHPLKSSNFDPRTYFRHLWGMPQKNFGWPGASVTEFWASKTRKILILRAKKNNVAEFFLLKYAMHETSKCSQFCIFQKYIKFIELSKKYEFIKPFWICKTSWSKKKLLKNEPNTELLFFLFPDIS